MNDRKFIVVLGMPRGGTSCVAKLLLDLGVNMGGPPWFQVAATAGRYCTWEDQRFYDAMRPLWGEQDWGAKLAKVREYIDRRMQQDGPQGVKFPGFPRLAHADGWQDLPIRVVDVRRPLADIVTSDLSRYQKQDAATIRTRAIRLAHFWQDRERFAEKFKGRRIPIEYYDVLEKPLVWADWLNATCCIGADLPTIEAAAANVRAINHTREAKA